MDMDYEESGDDSDSSLIHPQENLEESHSSTLQLLPRKSREKYEKEYDLFKLWCRDRDIEQVSEHILLEYFTIQGEHMKSPTLWSKFSMLRATLMMKDNINIKQYPSLIAYLKKKAVGYKPKKSSIFTREQVIFFLSEAPDDKYLMTKVVLIMGIAGACRGEELIRMVVDDIQDHSSVLLCTIPDSKTRNQRRFFVNNTLDGVNLIEIYKKYIALRPPKTELRRLFLSYRDGKCTAQPVGKNTICKMPSVIAKYLELHNAENYTGHCFRQTSATLLLADSGGYWQPPKVAAAQPEELQEAAADDILKADDYSSDINSDDGDNDELSFPPLDPLDICEAIDMDASDTVKNIKSMGIYDGQYDKFMKWCHHKNFHDLSEGTLMAYFTEKAETYKSSSLWALYSMLKATLAAKNSVDVGQYVKLLAFLKEKSEGYKPTESKSFTREEINRFLAHAPDEIYLMMKVAVIIGVAGGCRREDLVNMTADNVQDGGSLLVVKIIDSKKSVRRIFTVTNDFCDQSLELYRRYCRLRPDDCELKRLFFSYRSGKCTRQVVGINTFGRMPYQVATWLKIPNPELYTGHCFKKTAMNLRLDTGGNPRKRTYYGGPKPTSIYVENSVNNQFNVVKKQVEEDEDAENSLHSVLSTADLQSSFKVEPNSESASTPEIQSTYSPTGGVRINIINCSNCTINLNI